MQNTYSKEKDDLNAAKDKVGAYATTAIREGEEKVRDIVTEAEKRLKDGAEQAKKIAKSVDKQLHENPWPIVAGVAAGSLLLGFILGTSKRS